jgi:hypothetical protein
MDAIVSLFRKIFFNKRKHERFSVASGTFILVSKDPEGGSEWKVNVVDVSMGGLAFMYQGSPEELNKSGVLRMFQDSPKSDMLKYQTVSDVPSPGCGNSNYRKRGIKFEWMGYATLKQVKEFIKEYCIS